MTTATVPLSETVIKKYLKGRDSMAVNELRDLHSRLRLRVNKSRAGGVWYIVFYAQGKAVWKKLGCYPELSFKTLEKRLPDILARYALDDVVLTDQWEKVSGLLAWYQERLKGDRQITDKRKTSVNSAIKCHLLPKLGNLNIKDLERGVIDQDLIWPLQADYSASFILQVWGILKTALRRAHKLKLIERDPLANLKLSDFIVTKPKPKPAAIRPDYTPQIIQELERQTWPPRVLVSLMLLHGTRIGESRKAKWSDFDLINDYWHLPVENVKTREALRLPLTTTAKLLLGAYKQHQKQNGCHGVYLFPTSKRESWSESKAGKVIRQVSEGNWRAHDVRKLARTEWADLGIDYHIAERLLNHKMSKLDQTYIHTSTEKAKREALEVYHDWLNEQGFKRLINQDNAKIEGTDNVALTL